MKKAMIAIGLLGVAMAAQAASPEWFDREFTNSWDAPGKGLEAYLNEECQPSTLDGIQLVAVQDGHGRPYHIHIYCRHDRSPTARYRVTMPKAPKAEVFKTIRARVSEPNVRIGPFFLGDEDEPNGVLLVEKLR